MIAFTSTMAVSLFVLMPAHKTSYALIYNHVDNWNAMVRAGQVFRYLAATPTAAFLTRMTKISTGHASPTAGAASAMLLIFTHPGHRRRRDAQCINVAVSPTH